MGDLVQHNPWCDCEVGVQNAQKAVVRSLFPADWCGDETQIGCDFEMTPESIGPQGIWVMSARGGRRLEYILVSRAVNSFY